MHTRPSYYYRQSAVLPFKIEKDNYFILLITSRYKKKWIIPKGIVEDNLSAAQSAAKEAYEEAGIHGKIDKKSIGNYEYKKWGGICFVDVFPFKVTSEVNEWPEMTFRERKWFKLHKALKKIKNKPLKKIIKKHFKVDKK